MIEINISDQYREKFNKLLNLYKGNQDEMVSAILTFKINDLKKGIRNIETDLARFEAKYQMDTSSFYNDFNNGMMTDENDDFLVWSGEYETLQEFRKELKSIL
jgi:hypothetical protein